MKTSKQRLQKEIERQQHKQQKHIEKLQKKLAELPEVLTKLDPLGAPPSYITLDTFTVENIIYVIINDDTCAIIGTDALPPNTDLNVSYATDSSNKSRRVVAVYAGAFDGNVRIKTVVLPECLSIGADAFRQSGITEITSNSFPKCTTIGSNAFNFCNALTKVKFPNCTTIGSNAFNFCNALEKVEFPKCTTIGEFAFESCVDLKEVEFPKCTEISKGAFRSCDALKEVEFPNCTTIGNYAFVLCDALETVKFPKCTTIGVYAFGFCSALASVDFPKCVTIGDFAFQGCALKCVTIPCTIKYIGNDAFSDNPLERVNFEGSYDITTGSSPFLSYGEDGIVSTVLRVRIPDMCNVKKYANVLQLNKDIFRPLKICCKC
jgi:hypothetical protein